MKIKGLVAVFGLTALLAFAVACSNGEAAGTPAEGSEPDTSGQVGQPATGGEEPQAPASSGATAPSTEPAPSQGIPAPFSEPVRSGVASASTGGGSYSISPSIQTGSSQAGIWVMGQGSVTLEPDLALLNIGVETKAVNVSDARDEAARAMDAILTAVKARGLTDADVQTLAFNIYPQYEWQRDSERVLVGYMVNNTARIKIRELDSVGVIIDDVADAGGNATRINGISFTVEDPSPFMTGLREAAVNDAIAKATHFASLTGTAVGQLLYIAEVGGSSPVVQQDFGVERALAVAAAPPTSISGGELELRMSIQAVFGIQ